jgi:hypothetical protein
MRPACQTKNHTFVAERKQSNFLQEHANFDPLKFEPPSLIDMKLCLIHDVGGTANYAKFDLNPSARNHTAPM